MEGTVNCARRDEGRPALAGTTATATGAAFSTTGGVATGAFGLGGTGDDTGLTGLEETGMGAGLTGARGLETGWETTFTTDFPDGADDLTADLTAGLTGALTAVLLAGLPALGEGTTAAAFGAGFGAGFGLAFTEVDFFAGTLIGALTAGLAEAADFEAGLPEGLTSTWALFLVAVALLSFPVLAFTSCLLAERSCTWSVGPAFPSCPLDGFFDGGSSARECTGFVIGKPISCKIETIIWLSTR